MDKTVVFYGCAVVSALLLLYKISQLGMRPKGYPPGPPTIPLLGNLLQMPKANFHLEFQKWAKQYGPIVHLKLGTSDVILLNEGVAIRDLLEKRSSIYSARPDTYYREYNGNMNVVIRDNDEIWRRQRKMYHIRLNVKTSDTYLPYQHFESLALMADLLESPSGWVNHIQRYTASIGAMVVYGWRVPNTNAPYVQEIIDWLGKSAILQTLQLADFWSFLRPLYRMMPMWMSPFKRSLREIERLEDRLFIKLMDEAKAKLATGKVYPSFIRDMMLDKDADKLNDRQIAHNAAHAFVGATDTQWNTILGLIKGVLLFPETQGLAQEELDRVVGPHRMPVWEDRESLPYVRACVEEALRWMPTALTAGVPRRVIKEDIYNGYTIPNNATVIQNMWSLNHHNIQNSRDFNPSRHSDESTLSESNIVNPNSFKRPHFTFGAGRRVCPGMHVAERGLFIAISRILWGFNLSRKLDANGVPTPIYRDSVTPGFIVQPEAFECTMTVRDEARAALIKESWKIAQSKLDSEGMLKEEFYVSMSAK